MDKDNAKQPQPVDPTITIGAQTQANAETARLQQTLNNVNTTGPYGSVTWSQDPNNADRWSQNTTLSPAEQQTYDLQKQATNTALGVANQQAMRVQGALGQSPDLSIYNSLKDGIGRNDISYVPNQPPESRQESVARSGINMNPGQSANYANSFGRQDLSFAPQQPPETYQEGIQRQAMPQLGAQAGYQQQVGPTDFTADRNAVTDASWQQAMSRLQPEYGRMRDSMETKLANQGIGMQSTAYGAAQDQFGRQENDAYSQAAWNAVGQGAQEQQRLFDQRLAQGNFTNQAVGAGNADTLNFGAQRLGAQNQDYTQQMGQAGLYNQAQAASEAQTMDRLRQQNATQGQDFAQRQAMATFGNDAAAQQDASRLANFTAQNAAQSQDFSQNLAAGQFYNEAQQGNDQNNLAYWAQGLAAQNQGFNQNAAAAQFSNQARQQGMNEQAYQQNLPINQLSALLGLGQVGAPQGVQYTPTQVQGTDALGAYALQAQQQNSNYQGALSQQNAMLGGLAGLGQAAIFASDRRLKRDIERIGTRPDGLGVYAYRYLWSPLRHIGVMAQEVLRVKPGAVVRMEGGPLSGYLAVNYGAL